MSKSGARRHGAAWLQQPIEIGLHLRDPLKLQFELAAVRARDVFHLGDATLEVGGTPRPATTIAHARLNGVAFERRLTRGGALRILGWSDRVGRNAPPGGAA